MTNRFRRFSIRALLVFVTLFSVLLGLHVNRVTKQRQAVRTIQDLGGNVAYDYGGDGSGKTLVPRWAIETFGEDFFFRVVYVDLKDCKLTDDDFAVLSSLPRLEGLSLWNTPISDRGMVHIGKLHRLRSRPHTRRVGG